MLDVLRVLQIVPDREHDLCRYAIPVWEDGPLVLVHLDPPLVEAQAS